MADASSPISESHVVEIPIDSQTQPLTDHQQAEPDPEPEPQDQDPNPIDHHPLTEISESPGHLLLLKLLQREEDQSAHRIGLKEACLDSLKREAFFLSSLFFAFHGLFLTLIFVSSVTQAERRACKKWWVPFCLSLATSTVLVTAVQVKVWSYWRVMRGLQRERNDGRALTRLVQELRMKGSSFDLSKEPQVGKRVKSSSVEIEFRPVRWLKENAVTICMLVFTGLVAPACKFVLCS